MDNKIIRMKMTSINHTTGNGMIRSINGQAVSVRLSDKVIFNGIDEGDIATIRIINDEYVVTDFTKAEVEEPIHDDYNVDDLWEDY